MNNYKVICPNCKDKCKIDRISLDAMIAFGFEGIFCTECHKCFSAEVWEHMQIKADPVDSFKRIMKAGE